MPKDKLRIKKSELKKFKAAAHFAGVKINGEPLYLVMKLRTK